MNNLNYNNELAAFSMLYYLGPDEENLMVNLTGIDCTGLKDANYKLCIVKHDYRGNSLQYRLCLELIERAKKSGVDILCVTASPDNPYSIKNIEKLGFIYNRTFEKIRIFKKFVL